MLCIMHFIRTIRIREVLPACLLVRQSFLEVLPVKHITFVTVQGLRLQVVKQASYAGLQGGGAPVL